MRYFKPVVDTMLGILLAFDAVIGFQAYQHGWPKEVKLTEVKPGVEAVTVIAHPFTAADALIFSGLIVLHVLLIYLAWRLRKSTSLQTVVKSHE